MLSRSSLQSMYSGMDSDMLGCRFLREGPGCSLSGFDPAASSVCWDPWTDLNKSRSNQWLNMHTPDHWLKYVYQAKLAEFALTEHQSRTAARPLWATPKKPIESKSNTHTHTAQCCTQQTANMIQSHLHFRQSHNMIIMIIQHRDIDGQRRQRLNRFTSLHVLCLNKVLNKHF